MRCHRIKLENFDSEFTFYAEDVFIRFLVFIDEHFPDVRKEQTIDTLGRVVTILDPFWTRDDLIALVDLFLDSLPE